MRSGPCRGGAYSARPPRLVWVVASRIPSLQLQPHLIRRLKADRLVQRPSGVARMQRNHAQSVLVAPFDHRRHQSTCQSKPPRPGFSIDVENPRPLSTTFRRMARPRSDHNPAASHDLSDSILGHPRSVRPVKQRHAEILARHRLHAVKRGLIAISHLLKHRPSMMKKMLEVPNPRFTYPYVHTPDIVRDASQAPGTKWSTRQGFTLDKDAQAIGTVAPPTDPSASPAVLANSKLTTQPPSATAQPLQTSAGL
jgi:hypothetical protein